MSRTSPAVFLTIICSTISCGEAPGRVAARESARAEVPAAAQPRVWEPRPVVAPPDAIKSRAAADTAAADSLADSASGGRDSARPAIRTRGPRPFILTPADSARWPVPGPEPLPGSLLPAHRIVAYYGNPRSTRMGIMGQAPPDSMLRRLERVALDWAIADPGRKVMPALHLIAAVAQDKPGAGNKYRLRMGDSLISQVASWAEERGWIVFLDIQTGHSTVAAELEPLRRFLERPYVHLALDPEFAMKGGGVPGKRIGTLDAADVNLAIGVLGDIVTRYKLPPKVLVVHRFTRKMLTNSDKIERDPRVQVVIQMDGFGAPAHKQDGYRLWISPHPVQYTGFKLFYKNDRDPRTKAEGFEPSCDRVRYELVGCGDDGLMTPRQVLDGLYPVPLYIQYQ